MPRRKVTKNKGYSCSMHCSLNSLNSLKGAIVGVIIKVELRLQLICCY